MRYLKINVSIASRESESLERYLREIGKIKLLTPDEEIELASRIRKGDTVALEKLVNANLRFVVSVAKQYQRHGLDVADLINEGNIGLIRAAQRFDETKGFRFISYAVWWIRQAIIQAIAEHARIIRLPANKIGSLRKVNTAFHQLEQQYEREPTAEELAEVLHLNLEEVEMTMETAGTHVSVDAPNNSSDGRSYIEVTENPNAEPTDRHLMHKESLANEINRSLGKLGGRQPQVLKMHFGLEGDGPMGLETISSTLGISKQRVLQIKNEALAKLKASSHCEVLRAYLG